MACIYRLVVVLLLSMGGWSSVWASFPATSSGGTQYTVRTSDSSSFNSAPFASQLEACNWAMQNVGAGRLSHTKTINDLSNCSFTLQGDGWSIVRGNYGYGTVSSPVTYSCPSNATLAGSSCACDTGYNEAAGTCVKPVINNQQNCADAAAAGSSSFGQQRVNVKLASGTSMCISSDGNAAGVGCRVELLDVGVIKLPDGTRIVQGFPRRTNTGADTCPIDSASTAPKTAGEVEAAPKPCTNGQTGTYNGATVCIPYPAGTSVTTPTKSTTGTTTGTGVDGNTPTSSSASGETTCVTGTCTTTTTTTTTKGDGTSTTSTGTTTQSQGDYCSQNPKSIQCSSGAWGGSCSAGFTCDGDAVQCAVATEIHKRNCSLYDVADSDEVKAYKAALENPDRDKAGFAQGTVVEKAFQDQIKTDNALGAGASCIGDKQITVMTATVTIPFSQVCPWLDILGNALVAVGMVAAAVIVFRG